MKYLERSFPLRVSECDMSGHWRPGAMLVEMQEAAEAHCEALNCGRNALDGLNQAWVVARLELRILRYPVYGEELTLRTFHRPARHRFFPRFCEVRTREGELIALSSGLWLVMDLQTRQSVSGDRLPTQLPDNSDMPEVLPLPKGIEALETSADVLLRTSAYTDLDANGHVNNTRYVDWLCDALGVETMREHPPERITIHFNSEILPERQVEMRLRREGLRFQLEGIQEERKAFEISGELKA